jgi:hypothetical protein
MIQLRRGWSLILLCALVGCSAGERPPGASADSEAAPAPGAAQDGGLLKDPAFAMPGELEEHPLQHWHLSQHAGDPSYELRFGGSMIKLLRVGSEPWGVLQQHLDGSDFAGKTLEFSAELAGDLDDDWGPPIQATGLTVTVLGFAPQDVPMMGKRHLLVRGSDPGLPTGSIDWQRHSIRFEVPVGRELELLVGVMLTRGGELRIRNPSLQVITE